MSTPSRLVQTAEATLAVDTSVASAPGWADLLTINLTTGAGFLEAWATTSSSNSSFLGAQNQFRLVFDGVATLGTSAFCGGAAVTQSAAVCDRVAVTAGAHTVKLQWRCDTGTANINAISENGREHAQLLVNEVKS